MTLKLEGKMSRHHRTLLLGIACALLGAVFVLSGSIERALAQSLEQQIVDALKPKVKTRSLTSSQDSARDAEQRRIIEALPRTRSLSLKERDEFVPVAVEGKPTIDLEVYFDYNSAAIRSGKEAEKLTSLGRALNSPQLKGSTFLLAGHTDAVGGEEYNQQLSERRAEAIKRALIDQFGVPFENLVTAGYGKSQLKNPTDPFGSENRRVQIVNLETRKTAGQ
jgi:outer membrane protein OmpA-like peptidoglycan-associated protein